MISNNNLSFYEPTPTKIIKPFIWYKEEQSLKNNENYFEISVMMDELIFIVEISQELENSQKMESFIQNYDIHFLKELLLFEKNVLVSKTLNFETESNFSKNYPIDFYDKSFFKNKYLQRVGFLKEKFKNENSVNYNQTKECSESQCCFLAKQYKEKMYL